MPIIRTSHDKNNPYVQINKHGLEDPLVSWQAKGVWAYLISRPDNWSVSVPHLSSIYNGKGGGAKSIYSIIQELITHGYCYKKNLKNEKGHYIGFEYIVLESKNLDKLKNHEKPSHNESEPFPFEGEMAENTSERYTYNECQPFPFEGEMAENTSTDNKVPYNQNQPFASYRHAVQRHAVEVPPNKEGYIIKKEQNNNTSTKIINMPTSDNVCLNVVFSCLNSIQIPHDQKVIITKKYPEETVIQAIKLATRPGFTPDCLVAYIKWACERKPEIPDKVDKKDKKISRVEENKKTCESLPNEYMSPTYKIILGPTYIEFSPITTGEAKVLKYSEYGFNDKLDKFIRELKFVKLKVSNA